MTITITEALAEIKTINKRLEKKQQFILQYLSRQEGVKDPLAAHGGSAALIKGEEQSIADLQARVITLRRGIQSANEGTSLTIGKETRTIAEWLIWRRDIVPNHQAFLNVMQQRLLALRDHARRQGVNLVKEDGAGAQPTDIVVNIDEQALAKQIESLEETLGILDGQLSLKNATVSIVE